MGIPFKKTKDGITIEVKVEPRSSQAEIRGVMGSVLKVKLTSAPVDGAANRQLIELLSKEFGITKSSIKIVKGETSKNKVIKIEGIDSV
jgi:uncharacterized protein (TIGR00251 family)